MDEENLIQVFENGTEEDLCRSLKEFNTKNASTFAFPDMTEEFRKKMIGALLKKLKEKASSSCYIQCLSTVRIFSRDKNNLDMLVTDDNLKLLMKHAWLQHFAKESNEIATIQDGDTDVIVEAQKCLSNLIYNSQNAQRSCSMNGCVEGIVQRLKTYKDPELKYEIKFFDMRMLFLLTALVSEIRPRIHSELHGFSYLMEVIDLSLRDAEERQTGLTDQEVDLCCEILKILFNLTMSLKKKSLDEEEDGHLMRLVSVLRELLICKTESKDRKEELVSHTVNLLTNMPVDSFEQLLTPINESGADSIDNKDIEYDGKNMESIVVLLNFLHHRLERPFSNLKENLAPILHCLCEACRNNRSIRKFCRLKVLPHMRDEVKALPEEGDTLRNRLCRLLTNPSPHVKELVPDFLFTLCKENVDRMVKYTGYGNCAGLLADRGLLLGGRGKIANYSSESEDSETEEYSELKSMINPVTGRWEEQRPDPMENMSEEQKEYEAMKVVQMMDKLHQRGVIQPAYMGEDGRPIPVSHILELTDKIKLPSQENSDSD
ncbi:Synembryn-A [Acanthosepion pharaonis]|uniref:Synembryn-A n=1 Tax=Acanthosepion pharaonis TaxID=158019 RepID=A0A812ES63_ACAPH|nr:Synembryn-A [Sepia pharaonis]